MSKTNCLRVSIFILCASCSPIRSCSPLIESADAYRRPYRNRSGSSNAALVLDFTQPTLPAGAACSRASGTVFQQTSASTYASPALAAGTCIYESWRANLPGGWYVFRGYTNRINAFNQLDPGYTVMGAVSAAAFPGQTCPDGSTNSVYTITTTAAGGTQRYQENFDAGGLNGSSISVWLRDNVSNPPSSPGGFGLQAYPNFPQLQGAGMGTTWRHVYGATNAGGDVWWNLYPTGPTVVSTTTGAVDVCGAQLLEDENAGGGNSLVARNMVPLTASSTSAQDITMTTPSAWVQSGALNVDVSYEGLWTFAYNQSADFYIWSANTPDGEMSLRFSQAGGQAYVLQVRGSDVLTMAGSNTAALYSNTLDPNGIPIIQEVGWHCWDDPVISHSVGCQARVNGVWQMASTTSDVGAALSAPTAVHFLSNIGSTGFANSQITKVTVYKPGLAPGPQPAVKIVDIGDSLTRSNATYPQTHSFDFTANEIDSNIHPQQYDQALGGDTICGGSGSNCATSTTGQDYTMRVNNPYCGSSAIKAVAVQVGINDISAGNSETIISGQYQTLINDAKTCFPSAKIICGVITPAYQYWVTNFGTTTANANEATRQAFNNDIIGIGAHNIAGCDIKEQSYLPALTDVDGKSLLAACNVGTGIGVADGLHYTTCRAQTPTGTSPSQAYRADFIFLGL